jgi:hypothetical protein
MSHDPAEAEARRNRASKGGRTAGRGRPLSDVAEIKKKLSRLAGEVLEGKVDRSDATAVSQIWNCYLRATDLELRAREQDELEQRLTEIESALEGGPKHPDGDWYRPSS